MIDLERFDRILKSGGMTYADAGAVLGLSEAEFCRMLSDGLLGIDDAYKLCRVLEIDDPSNVFFA